MNSHFVYSTIVLTSVKSTSPQVKTTTSQLSTQKIAKQQFIDYIRQVFKPNAPIWLKIGQDKFYYAELLANGSDLKINPTRGNGTDKVVLTDRTFNSDWFIRECEIREGGAFYLPGQPQELHTKEHVKASNDIWVEIDTGSKEEQLNLYKWFEEISGLDLLLLSSGGKSVHGHLILDNSLPSNEILSLVQILCLILLADTAPASNIVQPMRIAGCFRKEKEKHQELIKLGSSHTLDEVRTGLIKVFQALDWDTRILEQEKIVLSRERWSALRKPLNPLTTNEKEKGIQPLTAVAKQEQLRKILAKSEEELFPKRVVKERLAVDYSNFSSSLIVPLKYFLSRENRNNLGGVSDHRNKTACALVADLLACEAWLTANGISYSGNAYDLFIDYCQGCASGNGWDAREWEIIWRSLSFKSFSPAITDEGMVKRLHSFRGQNDPTYQAAYKAEYRKQFTVDSDIDIYTDGFTADIPFNEPFLPSIDFKDKCTYLIKSAMATGKTFLLKKFIVDNYPKFINEKISIYYLGSRIGLQRQFIAEINQALYDAHKKAHEEAKANKGIQTSILEEYQPPTIEEIIPTLPIIFKHLNDNPSLDPDSPNHDFWLAGCVDSIHKIPILEDSNHIVILDEIVGTLAHIYHANTEVRNNRYAKIERFWQLIDTAKLVLCFDANLTNREWEHFKALSSREIVRVENAYQLPKNNPYNFLDGVKFSEKKLLVNVTIDP